MARVFVVLAFWLGACLALPQLQAWHRVFENGNSVDRLDVLSAPDGSVMVTSSGGEGSKIRRYSPNGVLLWDVPIESVAVREITQDASGNAIFVAMTSTFQGLVVGRVNWTNGAIHYTTNITFPEPGSVTSARIAYGPADDQVYVVTDFATVAFLAKVDNSTGATTSPLALPTLSNLRPPLLAVTSENRVIVSGRMGSEINLLKVDPTTMTLEWSRSVPGANATLTGIVPATQGAVFIGGAGPRYASDPDFFVGRVSSSGTLEFATYINGPGNNDDFASSMAVAPDGFLLAAGVLYTGPFNHAALLRFHPVTGQLTWTFVGDRVKGLTPLDYGVPKVVVDRDGNAILAATVLRNSTRLDTGIHKVSPTGVGQWYTWFDLGPNNYDSIESIAWGQGNSLYVAGTTTPQSDRKILLQKYQLGTLTVAPTTVVGGKSAIATLTLDEPARPEGYTITAGSTAGFITTPPTLKLNGGATSVSMTVQTTPVAVHSAGNVTLKFGNTTFTARLSVAAPTPATISVTPSNIIGGNIGYVHVALSGPTPTGGLTVALSKSNPIANVPAGMYIPAGQSAGTVPFSTGTVTADTQLTISAHLNNVVRTAPVTILRARLVAINTVGASIVGGTTLQGTVYLNGKAAGPGAVVSLTDNSAFVTVPATVTVPAGSKQRVYTAATSAVTSNQTVTITAVLNGITKTTTFTLSLPIHGILIAPDVIPRNSVSLGMVFLSHPAPTGGVTITLFSGAPSLVGVPSSVFIPAGGTSRAFTITTGNVVNPVLVGVFATYNGSTKRKDVVVVP